MKELRIAIIGQGRSGRNIHGSYFRSEANGGRFKVVAVVERLEHRRELAKVEYPGCDVYDDYTKLTEKSDFEFRYLGSFDVTE